MQLLADALTWLGKAVLCYLGICLALILAAALILKGAAAILNVSGSPKEHGPY